MADLFALFQEEQTILQQLRASDPAAVTPRRPFTPDQILAHIGIRVSFGQLPLGYLKLYHQDFIVEEVGADGRVSTIDPGPATVPSGPRDRTLYLDLVKVGHSTLEACRAVAEASGVEPDRVGYGGLKDKVAITSQRISLRGADAERVATAQIPGVVLKNLSWGRGVVERGSHAFNRFTIVVRSTTTVDEPWLVKSLEHWRQGFTNFFHLQRFGTPRLIGHVLGKLVLRGDYREAIRHLLADRGAQDVPLINRIRATAEHHFGDWRTLDGAFAQLPYTFRLERQILEYLIAHPDDYLGALRLLPGLADQVRLWVQAYASYLFNLHLSQLVTTKTAMPPSLPYLLNPDFVRLPSYVRQLAADGIRQPLQAAIFLLGPRVVSPHGVGRTVVTVAVHHARAMGRVAFLSFDLPPGAYATTFLMHFFALPPDPARALPPGSLDTDRYDSKSILGTGSVASVEAVLGPYIPDPEVTPETLAS